MNSVETLKTFVIYIYENTKTTKTPFVIRPPTHSNNHGFLSLRFTVMNVIYGIRHKDEMGLPFWLVWNLSLLLSSKRLNKIYNQCCWWHILHTLSQTLYKRKEKQASSRAVQPISTSMVQPKQVPIVILYRNVLSVRTKHFIGQFCLVWFSPTVRVCSSGAPQWSGAERSAASLNENQTFCQAAPS